MFVVLIQAASVMLLLKDADGSKFAGIETYEFTPLNASAWLIFPATGDALPIMVPVPPLLEVSATVVSVMFAVSKVQWRTNPFGNAAVVLDVEVVVVVVVVVDVVEEPDAVEELLFVLLEEDELLLEVPVPKKTPLTTAFTGPVRVTLIFTWPEIFQIR